MSDLIKTSALLFILLNPFLLVVYMIDVFAKLPPETFRSVVFRAGIISSLVFVAVALLGDVLFRDILQAQFASFEVFGGIVFLLIALRFVFDGNSAIAALRGDSQHLAGAIAMPVMIGPGTIGASIVIGKRLSPFNAVMAVILAVMASVMVIIALKYLHDYVRERNEKLVDRYIETAGRVTALVVGTFAIEMIMRGLKGWLAVV
ncbi:MAG: MarC family protein [Gammaproteobacteria bacterium]|nr:MarC family protein [Gammaproteobacteria bacterium]